MILEQGELIFSLGYILKSELMKAICFIDEVWNLVQIGIHQTILDNRVMIAIIKFEFWCFYEKNNPPFNSVLLLDYRL